MPRYDVHIYPIFTALVQDIEADSPEEACKKADLAVNFATFDQPGFEYADDIDGFLVDVVGDADHLNSTSHDGDYTRVG